MKVFLLLALTAGLSACGNSRRFDQFRAVPTTTAAVTTIPYRAPAVADDAGVYGDTPWKLQAGAIVLLAIAGTPLAYKAWAKRGAK
jgi:hypothetical protein